MQDKAHDLAAWLRRHGFVRLSFWTTVIQRFARSRADTTAASIAYYTLLSVVPLLVLALAVAEPFFGRQATHERLLAGLSRAMGPEAATTLADAVRAAALDLESPWKAALGLAILGWTASRIFVHVQAALDEIWHDDRCEDSPPPGRLAFFRRRAAAFVGVIGVGLLLVASLTVNSLFSTLAPRLPGWPLTAPLWRALQGVAMVLLVAAFAALVMRDAPRVHVTLRQVWPGALLTALAAVGGGVVAGAYLGELAGGSWSGAAASVVVVLLWAHYNALALLFGAHFAHARLHRSS